MNFRFLALVALLCLVPLSGCGKTQSFSTAGVERSSSSRPDAPSSTDETIDPAEVDWGSFSSTSLRNPNDGSLVGGVPLPLSARGLRFNPNRDLAARYGTVEVVRALVNAGRIVDEELGGLPVTINDLSYERGGPMPHHGSHQNGRDVDVFFYQLGPDGKPLESVGAFFDQSGLGVDFRQLADPSDDVPLRLDVPRTWRFVQALIEDEAANLQSIYLAEHLRLLLLEHARKRGAPEPTVARFGEMTCQPEYPHDDHFHFRFYCSADDIEAGCRDSDPIYAWRKRALAEIGVESLPLLPKRERARTKTVGHEEARRAAGPLDPEVERWLERRKQWRARPHPGRRYCP
ncbi:MAG: penicillin-insensitive murein endopeptidase [Myxococcales bacterium]|nr:penicillin-insensitive murein endopeptidase [Myxococcales bacterium]MDH3486050.1 penicillin-insensitive murein endopeptidase [Myxococcales bacterium]